MNVLNEMPFMDILIRQRALDTAFRPMRRTPRSGRHCAAIDATLAPVDPETVRARAPMFDHRLRAAIAYMREHVADPIAVEDVAGKVGLSRVHFFSLFRDQLNTTPQVFWSAVRVEEAIRMLTLRDEPLTSVAMELGFSSPGNFSRFFREHMGVSPSRYRRVAAGPQLHPITGMP
jgi:transcriptional regulator GlxA family with amidase domain